MYSTALFMYPSISVLSLYLSIYLYISFSISRFLLGLVRCTNKLLHDRLQVSLHVSGSAGVSPYGGWQTGGALDGCDRVPFEVYIAADTQLLPQCPRMLLLPP